MATYRNDSPFENVLHTNSDWFHPQLPNDYLSVDEFKKDETVKNRMEILEAQERALYNKYGFNNFIDFRDFLRDILKKTEVDAQVISDFSNDKIKKIVRDRFINFKVSSNFNQEVYVEFKGQATDFSKVLKGQNITINNKVYLKTQLDIETLKNVMNRINQLEQKRSRFKSKKSTDLTTLNKALPRAEDYFNFYVTSDNNTENLQQIFLTKQQINNTFWGLTTDEIDRLKNDKEGRNKLLQFYDQLRNFLIVELPWKHGKPSEELQWALKTTFDSKINRRDFDTLLFFGKAAGANFMNTIVGSLGEFQTALIFNYIKLVSEKIDAPMAKIIGDNLKNGRQIKSDVQLLKGINIQVKNYNPHYKKDIPINFSISAADFGKYGINPEDQGLFGQIIANAAFNADFTASTRTTINESFQRLETYLGYHFMELLSTALLNDEQNFKTDKVTFFFISGRYLVPASAIYNAYLNRQEELRNLAEKNIDNLITISNINLNPKGSNQLFQINQTARARYWIGNKEIGWSPTDYNKSQFDVLMNNNSFKVNVSRYFLTMSEFSIF